MAITLPVEVRPDGKSVDQTADRLQQRFTKAGQESGRAFSRGLESGADKMTGLYDKVADAVGRVRTEQAKLNDIQEKGIKDARLISQVEKVEAAKRREAAAVRAATEEYRRHEAVATGMAASLGRVNSAAAGAISAIGNLAAGSRLGALATSVGGLAAGFSQAGTAVGTLGSAFAAAGLVAGGAVVVGIGAITAGVAAATDALYDMGRAWDDVSDSIAVKTGLAGDALDQMMNTIGEIGTKVPADFAVIGDVAAQVAQSLGLVGDSSEPMITALSQLKTLGVDVDVDKFGQAMRALNQDQSAYLADLEKFQNLTQTGLSMDSILSAIEGGKGAIDAFGLSVDDVIGLMRKFREEGLSPEQAMSTLNKAFAVLSKAPGGATKDNLLGTLNEIKQQMTTDLPGAAQRLNDLFGAKGGGGDSWLKVVADDAFNLTAATEAPRTNIQNLTDSTADLEQSWKLAKNTFEEALRPLSTEVFNGINDALKDFGKWIGDHKPEIIGFFTGVATQVFNVAEVLTKGLGEGLLSISTIMLNMPEFLGGGEKWKGAAMASAELVALGAKLDIYQQKIQAAGDKANDAAQKQREMGDAARDAAPKIDDQASAAGRLADALGRLSYEAGKNGGMYGGGGEFGINPAPGTVGPHRWAAGGASYGMPTGSNSGGYGGGGTQFPAWVYDVAQTFGIKPSTYPGHQESNRNEPGYAPNPNHENRGIDWTGPVENLQRFADYLSTVPQAMEQVIWENPFTHRKTGIGGRQINPGYYDQATYDEHGGNDPKNIHVHTRQSSPIPLPGSGMRNFAPASLSGFKAFAPGGTAMSMDMPGDTGAGPQPSPLPAGTEAPLPGLKPGPVGSTFGYNEYGEPGYYRPDEKSVRGAARAARNAEESVGEADKRVTEIQQQITELQQQKATLGREVSVDERNRLEKQLESLQNSLENAQRQARNSRETAQEAQDNLAEAQRGRFTAARAESRGGGRGMSGQQIGAPIAPDFGLSQGLPGLAENLTNFLGNMAFAPALGALSGLGAGLDPTGRAQTGGGLFGMLGALAAPNVETGAGGYSSGAVGGSSLAMHGGTAPTVSTGLGMSAGMGPSTVGAMGAPPTVGGLGGGAGAPVGVGGLFGSPLGAAPGPAGPGATPGAGGMGGATPNLPGMAGAAPTPSSMGGISPGAGPGGGGFGGAGSTGIGGMAMSAIQSGISMAGAALDTQMPGAGTAAAMAANIGVQLGNRAIGQAGKAAGLLTGGIMETLLPANSKLADPNANWFGKIAAGFAGAKPAIPNMTGQPAEKPSNGQTNDPLNDPASAAKGGATPGDPSNGANGGITVNYTNNMATEDRAGADLTNHLMAMNAVPMAAGAV